MLGGQAAEVKRIEPSAFSFQLSAKSPKRLYVLEADSC
jgi:hypothetical protein